MTLPRSWGRLTFWGALIAAAFASAIAAWYWEYRPGPFAQDDPGLISALGSPDRSALEKIFATDANRLRPVANAGYLLVYLVTGNSFTGWWLVNVLLLGLTAALASMTIWWITRNSYLGLGAGVLLCAAPFAQYQVVTATGLVEGLSLLWFVVTAMGVIAFARTRRSWTLALSAVAFALLVLTHERFQLLAIPLVIFALISPGMDRRKRVIWSAIFLAPVAALTVAKAWIAGIPLLVGSGTSTEVGFSWDTTMSHVVSAAAQLFGINWGPALFNGKPITEMEPWLQGMSFALGGLTVLLLLGPIRERFSEGDGRARQAAGQVLLLITATALALLIPIVITSRLDQRWLMSLYIIVIGCIAFLARKPLRASHAARTVTTGLLIAFSASALVLDVVYRGAMAPLHFMGNKASIAVLVDQLRPAWVKAEGRPIYIVDPSGGAGWGTGLNQAMFANTDLGERDITVLPSLSELPSPKSKPVALFAQPETGVLTRLDEAANPGDMLLMENPPYGDGWVGPSLTAAPISPACRRIAILAQSAPWGRNTMTVTTNFGTSTSVALGQKKVRMVVPLAGLGSAVHVRFGRAWIPKKINAGADEREISAKASVECLP